MFFLQMIMNQFHRYLYPRHRIRLHKCTRGMWYDIDEMMFESAFELLCTYIEDECAAMQVSEQSRWKRFKMRWFPRQWRMPESRILGLEYLDACIVHQNDDPTSTAAAEYDILRNLYIWYRDIYPARESPWDAVIEPEYMFLDDAGLPTKEMLSDKTLDNGKTYSVMNRLVPEYEIQLNHAHHIEDTYHKEKDDQLAQLIALRHRLWT